MTTSRLSPVLTASTALTMAALLAACAPQAAPGEDPEQGPDSSESAEAESQEEPASGGGIDTLYSEALHDGVETAAAGTAYIEIEGERLEFGGLECRLTDRDDGGAVTFTVEAETAYGVTELSFVRNIGWLGFDYEEELVQVTHLGGTGGRGELNDISMAQNGGDEEGGIEWYRGDGPDPMAQIVGADVTAMGTLAGLPGAENPQEGDFVLAANCG